MNLSNCFVRWKIQWLICLMKKSMIGLFDEKNQWLICLMNNYMHTFLPLFTYLHFNIHLFLYIYLWCDIITTFLYLFYDLSAVHWKHPCWGHSKLHLTHSDLWPHMCCDVRCRSTMTSTWMPPVHNRRILE